MEQIIRYAVLIFLHFFDELLKLISEPHSSRKDHAADFEAKNSIDESGLIGQSSNSIVRLDSRMVTSLLLLSRVWQMLCKPRRKYLQRFAILLRLQDQGSPSMVVSPFGWVKRDRRFTQVRSIEAIMASRALKSICHTRLHGDS